MPYTGCMLDIGCTSGCVSSIGNAHCLLKKKLRRTTRGRKWGPLGPVGPMWLCCHTGTIHVAVLPYQHYPCGSCVAISLISQPLCGHTLNPTAHVLPYRRDFRPLCCHAGTMHPCVAIPALFGDPLAAAAGQPFTGRLHWFWGFAWSPTLPHHGQRGGEGP